MFRLRRASCPSPVPYRSLNPQSSIHSLIQTSILNPIQTSILNPLFHNLNPQSSILNPKQIVKPQSSILNPQSCKILNPQSSILNPLFDYLNPQSSIHNPKTLRQNFYLNPQSSSFAPTKLKPQSTNLYPLSSFGVFRVSLDCADFVHKTIPNPSHVPENTSREY